MISVHFMEILWDSDQSPEFEMHERVESLLIVDQAQQTRVTATDLKTGMKFTVTQAMSADNPQNVLCPCT